jgi:hypothetical protein
VIFTAMVMRQTFIDGEGKNRAETFHLLDIWIFGMQ